MMTNQEKLMKSLRLVEEVWSDLVPDSPPRTVAEDEYFEAVDATASRILSDIAQMQSFALHAEL